MYKNVLKLLLLFGAFSFFLASCSSSRKVSRDYSSKNSTKKSAESKEYQLRKSLANHAKTYQGIPYKYAGKTPKTGFDCSGFTSFVLKKFEIEISPGSKLQAKAGKAIPLKRAKPGDLIFFGKGRKVTHVALVTNNTKEGIEIVHSTSSKGIMVQNVSKSSYWKPKILFARDVISKQF